MTSDFPVSSPSAILEQARRFDAFVRRYRRPLMQYFRRRGLQSADAEDLCQTVFLRLLHKLQADGETLSDGYVFMAASSVLIDHYRRRSANPVDTNAEIDPQINSEEPGPDRIFEDRQALRVMLDRLSAMRPKWRRVFMLHRFESLSHTEIAKRMGLSVSSVEKYVMAALAELRDAVASDRHD